MENGIVGIDLAGKQHNPTGWAFRKNNSIKTCLVYADEEILRKILKCNPILVVTDAPFGFPK
jgi:predicted nuclease with RNAse H fold